MPKTTIESKMKERKETNKRDHRIIVGKNFHIRKARKARSDQERTRTASSRILRASITSFLIFRIAALSSSSSAQSSAISYLKNPPEIQTVGNPRLPRNANKKRKRGGEKEKWGRGGGGIRLGEGLEEVNILADTMKEGVGIQFPSS